MSGEVRLRPEDTEERRKRALIAGGVVGTWEHDHARDLIQYCAIGARLLAGDATLAWCDLDPVRALAGVYTDDQAALQTRKHRAVQASGVFIEEHRVRSAQDEVHRVLRRGRTYRDAEGRPTITTGVVIDITEIQADGFGRHTVPDGALGRAADHGLAAYEAIQESGLRSLIRPARALLMAIGREIARGMPNGCGRSH